MLYPLTGYDLTVQHDVYPPVATFGGPNAGNSGRDQITDALDIFLWRLPAQRLKWRPIMSTAFYASFTMMLIRSPCFVGEIEISLRLAR